jgi:hypothetical protein
MGILASVVLGGAMEEKLQQCIKTSTSLNSNPHPLGAFLIAIFFLLSSQTFSGTV